MQLIAKSLLDNSCFFSRNVDNSGMIFHYAISNLGKDSSRIGFLYYGHLFFLILAFLLEMKYEITGHLAIIKIITILIIIRPYLKTIKELYYSYWMFAAFILIISIFGLTRAHYFYNTYSVSYAYGMALVLLGVKAYILSSPIYYPRVNWWEYDFRYRLDWKIKTLIDGQEINGRLTDLRRGAGCVLLFEDIELGKIIALKTQAEYKEIVLKGEIISKRESTRGRGITYGVRFVFDEAERRSDFDDFCLFWKHERASRRKKKFEKI